jgi:CMP-N-acetylneuraminic acid synthetase
MKKSKVICMIPARMGSQRLKQKNLRLLNGVPLITRAIQKAKKVDLFDEIWVNSEHNTFKQIAEEEGINFHNRPVELANNTATSEDFVYEFMKKHKCDFLVQLHTIAPLLDLETIKQFTHHLITTKPDAQFSVILEQIECFYNNSPINFDINNKSNSQELKPIQRLTWSITGWKTAHYIKIYEAKHCATYAGTISFFTISRLESLIIKNKSDLELVKRIL